MNAIHHPINTDIVLLDSNSNNFTLAESTGGVHLLAYTWSDLSTGLVTLPGADMS